MRTLAIATLLATLGLGACTYDKAAPTPPPPPPPRASAPMAPPPPPPGGLTVTGTVTEKRGACHTIAGDNGVRYAVHRGVLGANIPQGVRVRITGVIHPNQDCRGATVLRATNVSRLGGTPRASK